MSKHIHEIRDPIHIFVHLDSDERAVVDSRPFQRLRHIHQLALTYLLYPAATHKRFEHSLGVMELAGRVFDVVTNPANVTDQFRRSLPDVSNSNALSYWRRVVEVLQHLPVVAVDYVFINPDLLNDATAWLQANREQLIQAPQER